MKRYKSDLDFLENYWKDAKEIADNGRVFLLWRQLKPKLLTKNKY